MIKSIVDTIARCLALSVVMLSACLGTEPVPDVGPEHALSAAADEASQAGLASDADQADPADVVDQADPLEDADQPEQIAQAVAGPVSAAAVSRKDKYKSVRCTGGRIVRVWYRVYDNNRSMLRKAWLWNDLNNAWQKAYLAWRADGGKKTFASTELYIDPLIPNKTENVWQDQDTPDVAVALSRKPYVKIMSNFMANTSKCTKYITLN